MDRLMGLCRWAMSLRPEHVPADVLTRAALQHVSSAAAMHLLPPTKGFEGALSSVAERDFDDLVLAPILHPSRGAVVGAWFSGEAHTTGEVLTATVAANEVAARIDLSNRVELGAAVSTAWLRDLGHGSLPESIRRRTKSTDIRVVSLGMPGHTWFTRCVLYRLIPGPIWALSALEATNEIVRRHIKAAGRALRADQVVEIRVRLCSMAWQAHRAKPDYLPNAMGTLLEHADANSLKSRPGGTATAGKVKVYLDPRLSLDAMGNRLQNGFTQRMKQWSGHRLHKSWPVDVEILTHRGGSWRDRRRVVGGGPEYALEQLIADVTDKFASGSDHPKAMDHARRFALDWRLPWSESADMLGIGR